MQIGFANDGFGFGLGLDSVVVIAKDQVLTNCHEIAGAISVNIKTNDEISYCKHLRQFGIMIYVF